MNITQRSIIIIFILNALAGTAQEPRGATIPWTTIEAEHMTTTGTVLGPKYDPYQVETESSGQQCVKLTSKGQFVEFSSPVNANSIVIRYSLPDKKEAVLAVYNNGNLTQHYKITSRYSRLYGKYPFTNDPAAGSPRNFYDEIRIKDIKIKKGDPIRIQREDDNTDYCILDLVDLENIPSPLSQPASSLSITDKAFHPQDGTDDNTDAFRNCIAQAVATKKTVWIPAGTYKITGDIILPENITIQGAGMWYTQLVGEETLYTDAKRRVRLKGNGSNIHLSDFSIIGKLNYRSDQEANDGIVGSFGINSTISRLWIEHTKVGMWIENSMNLKITGCRLRNTMADGINFCVGMAHSTIEDCTARGTGDDCFAFWPAVFARQQFQPGYNLISHCTAQLPFLANGAAIYGGESNSIKDCSFVDISQGSAILLSTTFPTETKDGSVNNNFSGTTVISNCDIKTSGGFDHEWDWRAAIEICLDRRSISGVEINNIRIENSLSNGISIMAKQQTGNIGVLTNASLKNISILNYGVGVKSGHGLFISADAQGSLDVNKSNILELKNESENFSVH
ncbi:MAG TPA: glycosyl hydrolase family 28-related protein [Puia sp.]|nr:glycosyl hydrolase family 28-related protein [Puia sp.]